MSIQFFVPKDVDSRSMILPQAYSRKVKWLPQIGDIFPNFKLATTQGDIDFWSWAEGSWVLLFSHPAANTPVCTTEMGALAANEQDFKALGTKVMGLTGSTVADQLAWHEDIEDLYKTKVWFPTAADIGGKYAAIFGMNHVKEHKTWPIRKSFVLDPQMRIRMIFEYPIYVGRSVEETLRVIEALQLREETGFATPSDWLDGDPVIVPDDIKESDVFGRLGVASHYVLPYLRIASPLKRRR